MPTRAIHPWRAAPVGGRRGAHLPHESALFRGALNEVKAQVQRLVFMGASGAQQHWQAVVERSSTQIDSGRDAVGQAIHSADQEANRLVASARERSQSLVREIVGQGPQKALDRGLAIVRAEGRVITSARQLNGLPGQVAEVEFHDGRVQVSKPTESR